MFSAFPVQICPCDHIEKLPQASAGQKKPKVKNYLGLLNLKLKSDLRSKEILKEISITNAFCLISEGWQGCLRPPYIA